MAYSSKSNTVQFIVRDEETNEIIHDVIVQGDKQDRICEMYPRVGNLLEEFRGKQINSEITLDNLYNKLANI
jgi:hypothetical protein